MIGEVIRITASFLHLASEVRQWVWHYEQSVGGASDYDDLLAAVQVRLADAWTDVDSHISNDVTGTTTELSVYDVGLNQWDTVAVVDNSALLGLSSADPTPGNASPYVTFFTNVGRSRGKKKLFDVQEVDLTGDFLYSALIVDMALFGAKLDNVVVDGGNSWRPGNFNQATTLFRRWTGDSLGVGAITGSEYQRLSGRGI